MTQTRCGCPSCAAGLSCYVVDRDVATASGPRRRLLWGEVLELAQLLGGRVGDVIRTAANTLESFSVGGVEYAPTRPR